MANYCTDPNASAEEVLARCLAGRRSNGCFSAVTESTDAFVDLIDLDGDGDADGVLYNPTDQTASIFWNRSADVVTGSGTGHQTFEYAPSVCQCFTVPSRVTDELGRVTVYEHDKELRVTKMRRVIGEDDEAEGVTETDDAVWTYDYLALDYDVDGDGNLELAAGDRDYGLVDAMTDAEGVVTRYRYDQLGRLVTVIFAYNTGDEAQVGYTYDLYGNVASVTDELGRTTRYEYDIMDRLLRVTEADPDDFTASGGSNGSLAAPVSTFGYDIVGRLTRATDPLGRTTRFVYDVKDRLVATIDPLGGVTSSSYDRAGNLVATTDQLGRTTRARQWAQIGHKQPAPACLSVHQFARL